MAPLYDYECPCCQAVFEQMARVEESQVACERCSAEAKRIISSKSAYRSDASWVADCTIPFDPEDSRPEVRHYLANPSDRAALKRACQVAGIRHADHGETGRTPRRNDITDDQLRVLVEKHKARAGRL